jgi:hypothetical protein
MTDTTKTIDIDAVEARRDELTREYADIWRSHNGAISAIPVDASLRDMDDRRDRAARDTAAAAEDQRRVADELLEGAEQAVEWSHSILDTGDYSDGLDGMDRDALTRVFDRAVIRGDRARAIAAARLLDADGDSTAMPRLSANYDDVRVALDYLDAYGRDAQAILAPLRGATVRMPDDQRIRPNIDVARQIEREDAEIRAAEEAAALEARRKLHDELSRPLSGGKARSVESRQRVKRAPFGYNR